MLNLYYKCDTSYYYFPFTNAILFSKNIDITMVMSSKSLFHELTWNYILTMLKVW